jgi:hypothetical protein
MLFDKKLKLVAIDKETKERFIIEAIYLPLGKPSGKDIVVIIPTEDESECSEWRSIDEVDIVDDTE